MEQPDFQDSAEIESPDSDAVESEELDTTDEHEEPEEGQPDDSEEVEFEGEKFKLPSKLKEALMRQADYTRKTQEVAESRRSVEAERQAFELTRQFHAENMREVAKVMAIDQQLEQYRQVDWNALSDNDPIQAMKLDRQFRELQAQRAQAEQSVTQRQRQAHEMQQQQAARQIEEGQRVLKREIPNWGPDVAQKITEYGLKRGYSPQVLQNVMNPQFVVDLYNSYQMSEMKAKATKKPNVVQEKPVTKIQATKASANRDPDKMNADEWLKWRNSQIKKR